MCWPWIIGLGFWSRSQLPFGLKFMQILAFMAYSSECPKYCSQNKEKRQQSSTFFLVPKKEPIYLYFYLATNSS